VRIDRHELTGGGTDGNEQLTAVIGVVLIVLLAVLGITILRVRQLIWPHLFLGLLLLGPVAAKMASTGYRFVRYYSHSPAYRLKGPPPLILRSIAPVVVCSTLVVFASGIVLLLLGPVRRGPWVAVHKVSFIVWVVFTAMHVLGHLAELPSSLRAGSPDGQLGTGAGSAGRWITLAGAIVAGVVIAIVLLPHFGGWTAAGAFRHHEH
jgi:hypothetical protein